jgi:hypothetical protein
MATKAETEPAPPAPPKADPPPKDFEEFQERQSEERAKGRFNAWFDESFDRKMAEWFGEKEPKEETPPPPKKGPKGSGDFWKNLIGF